MKIIGYGIFTGYATSQFANYRTKFDRINFLASQDEYSAFNFYSTYSSEYRLDFYSPPIYFTSNWTDSTEADPVDAPGVVLDTVLAGPFNESFYSVNVAGNAEILL